LILSEYVNKTVKIDEREHIRTATKENEELPDNFSGEIFVYVTIVLCLNIL